MAQSQSELELLEQAPLHRYRKLRLYFAYPFAGVLAFFARSTDQGFWIGVPVIILGEAIRIWSHGYIRKAKELATDGPYAFVRNPLYVGNFLIGLGFCVIIWNPFVVAIYALGFLGVYWITIRGEEQRLSFKFKEQYSNYVKHVPRFIPRLSRYQKRLLSPFNVRRALEHGEQITLFSIVTLLLILYLRQEIFQEGKSLVSPDLFAVNLIFLASSVLLVVIFFKRWTKKNI